MRLWPTGFDFLKFYLEKPIDIAVVGNVQATLYFLTFPELQSFGRFGAVSEAKVKFSGSQIVVKHAKKHIFSSILVNF